MEICWPFNVQLNYWPPFTWQADQKVKAGELVFLTLCDLAFESTTLSGKIIVFDDFFIKRKQVKIFVVNNCLTLCPTTLLKITR